MITLRFDADTNVVLPSDLAWSDSRSVTAWAQDQERAIDGTLHVETSQVKSTALTLSSGNSGSGGYYGWMTTAGVDALRALFEQGDAPMTLQIGQQQLTVMLDRAAGGFEATALKVRPAESRPATDKWLVVFHFIILELL